MYFYFNIIIIIIIQSELSKLSLGRNTCIYN